jgi:hypothetical protein
MLADSQGRGNIIWPIAQKLFQSVMLQQRPKWTGGLRISVGSMRHAGTRPTLPWDDGDRPPVIAFSRYDTPPRAFHTTSRNFALCALNTRRENLSEIEDPHKAVQYGLLNYQPAVVHALKPLPATFFTISGVTRDSANTPLASCAVDLFETNTDIRIGSTTSNLDGNFYFKGERGKTYYIVAYKAGGTDVAGTTVNTLTAT